MLIEIAETDFKNLKKIVALKTVSYNEDITILSNEIYNKLLMAELHHCELTIADAESNIAIYNIESDEFKNRIKQNSSATLKQINNKSDYEIRVKKIKKQLGD